MFNVSKYYFKNKLIDWYSKEMRILPWREDTNPYKIWLSEIILQQTRVDQGLPYYLKFVGAYPTIRDFANADEQDILKLWEGLGYYTRARNMLVAAKQVQVEFNGQFPNSNNTLLKLKGVGIYTAAAIASICFNIPIPVIDGNVFRVISRVYGITADISIQKNRKIFNDILLQVISKNDPGTFNQAMMELGALICLPKNPRCEICPLKKICPAFAQGTQSEFPVNSKKIKVKERNFHYLVISYDGKFAMKCRKSGDIWQGLWDFYLLERRLINKKEIIGEAFQKQSGPFIHLLTHQKIKAWFYEYQLSDQKKFNKLLNNLNLKAFELDEIVTLPKSKLIVNYLSQRNF